MTFPADLSAPTDAVVTGVHDGDSITVSSLDLGVKPLLGYTLCADDVPIRLAGCNARELSQPGGPEAHANLAALLPVGTRVTVVMVGGDEYGRRRDARITLADGTDLVQRLIADGWVAPWNGRGPKPVPPWPRPSGVD